MPEEEKLIILDRDGVINYNRENYVKNPDEWIPIPGSLSAIVRLNRAGYHVVIATNQSGVDRGYYSLDMLNAIHEKMQCELAKAGAHCLIVSVYFCPHVPEANCTCRKPKPGLLHLIAKDFPKLFMGTTLVGDSLRDIQAAKAAGCRAVLVKTARGEKTITNNEWLEGVPIFENLSDYVSHLTVKSS